MSYELHGVPVHFPYQPYDCQLAFMSNVIQSLQSRQNAMLESPTGTGKSLCLLTSTLAWLSVYKARQKLIHFMEGGEYNPDYISLRRDPMADLVPIDLETPEECLSSLSKLTNAVTSDSSGDLFKQRPVIIYTSRTHSQLTQVIGELNKTIYRPRICVLGSREQLCVHSEVRKLQSNAAQTSMCNSLVKNQKCSLRGRVPVARAVLDQFASRKEDKIRMIQDEIKAKVDGLDSSSMIDGFDVSSLTSSIMDIEDLVKFGEKNHACPYYLTREYFKEADVLFMPYNYLVDANTRMQQGIKLENAIVIFDEAHNIESSCGEARSFELTTMQLSQAIGETETCLKLIQNETLETESPVNSQDVMIFKVLLLKLEEALMKIPLQNQSASFPGDFIYKIFEEIKLNEETVRDFIPMLDQVLSFLVEDSFQYKRHHSTQGLRALKKAVDVAFSPSTLTELKRQDVALVPCFRVHIQQEPVKGATTMMRTLHFWCFNAGIGMRDLVDLGVRSIILTSGTLSPLESLIFELGIPFPFRLENPHVIDASQIFVGILSHGPCGQVLNSSYERRDLDTYKSDLGNTIANLCRIVPDGLLVFFPSYHVMDKCIAYWQSPPKEGGKSLWERFQLHKETVVEPRGKQDFQLAIQSFYGHVDRKQRLGAVFFAVCRGKVSEGLDFANERGRAVVITGQPFPPAKDPQVELKRQYLDDCKLARMKKKMNGSIMDGHMWYTQQAARAVNQAIGRVIRHRNDYGAILLCDERFERATSQLPVWVRPFVKTYSKFGEMQGPLVQFYRAKQLVAETSSPTVSSKVVPLVQPSNSSYASSHHQHLLEQRSYQAQHALNVMLNQEENELEVATIVPVKKSGLLTLQSNHTPVSRMTGNGSKTGAILSKQAVTTTLANKVALSKNRENDKKQATVLNMFQKKSHPEMKHALKEELSLIDEMRQLAGEKGVHLLETLVDQCANNETVSVDLLAKEMHGLLHEQANGLSFARSVQVYLPAPLRSRYWETLTRLFEDVSSERNKVPLPLSPQPIRRQTPFQWTKKPRTSESVPVPAIVDTHLLPPDKRFECSICMENARRPCQSKCGHVCCWRCWQVWLEKNETCPVCRASVFMELLVDASPKESK